MTVTKPIVINSIEFEPRPDCKYKHDYLQFARVIDDETLWHKALNAPPDVKLTRELVERSIYRYLILNDLFFIVYFVVGIESANKPFVVGRCLEQETGPKTKTLDVWARYHFKSTIITGAETVQYHLRKPEECTCIFSYKKPAAEDFLDSVRKTYEKPIIKFSFPDVVYDRPEAESPSWSLQGGITLKRRNTSRKEKTVEASGLVEGMVTGSHFERRIYDDIEVADMAESMDELNKCFSRFEMSSFLGTGQDTDIERVIGTFYSHSGPLVRIREKKKVDGTPEYNTRIIPGSHDGTVDGRPVLMSKQKFDEEKMKEHFNSQILCNPTPTSARKLNSQYLIDIEPELIPRNVVKIMIVDPAGDDKGKGGTDWAILVFGVEPKPDDLGQSNVYLMNAMIEELKEVEAPEVICRMYISAGIVLKLGVEKVAQSTTEIHVANALSQRGRRISVEDGSLVILTPQGREKIRRITDGLAWPLNNAKLHMSKAVPQKYRDRIRMEMDKFPVWKKDGIDAWSYIYDILKDLKLGDLYQANEYQFKRAGYTPASPIG